MAIKLIQSTASQEIPLGYFVDSTDGNTEETALTIANTDIKLWKMGATTLANKNSGGATHISNGIYYCVLDATDTNTLGALVVFVHVSGALAVKVECEVLPANIYNSWIAGTDVFDVSTTQFNGTAVTSSAGRPEVNMTHIAGSAVSTTTAQIGVNAVQISGDGTAADNLEAAHDGTGYAHTGNTYPWTAAWDAEVQSEVEDALQTTITDSIPADGTRPSVWSALLMITRFLWEKAVSGTTVTVKKEDGSTSSFTATLDSSTDPTSITRAT